MLGPHIVKSFDVHLQHLKDLICQMGVLASKQVALSLSALDDLSASHATLANAQQDELSALHQAVLERTVTVLALRAPVADDLRLVTSGLKIAGDLEQIGSYASGNIRRAIALRDHPPLDSLRSAAAMGRRALQELATVLTAYHTGDSQAAVTVWQNDWRLDEDYSGLFRQTVSYMLEDPATITAASHLLFIAKNLERIGDHATNIAEMVYFLIIGKPLAEERRKGDSSLSVDDHSRGGL